MFTGMTHTHVAASLIFFLIYFIKTILLLANKHETLAAFSRRTRIVEGVFGGLMVLTGVYLYFASAFATEVWMTVKIVGVLAFLFIGVRSFRKRHKLLAVLNLFLFFYLFVISRTKTLTGKETWVEERLETLASLPSEPLARGKVLYEQLCAPCHGIDGTDTREGAKKLAGSQISFFQIPEIIRKGKKTMPAFGKYLSEEDIRAVTQYVITLTRSPEDDE